MSRRSVACPGNAGIPPLRDSAAECLWYAVSGRAKDPKQAHSTGDGFGQFVIQDASGNDVFGSTAHARPLWPSFSPRPPLNGQNRPTTTAHGAAARTWSPTIPNSSTATGLPPTSPETFFIRVANADSQRTGTSNDRALWVENRDVFRPRQATERLQGRHRYPDERFGDLLEQPRASELADGLRRGNKGHRQRDRRLSRSQPVTAHTERKVLDNWQDNLLLCRRPHRS